MWGHCGGCWAGEGGDSDRWLAFAGDPAAFVRDCVYIYDATGQDWVRFDLWPAQAETLATMVASRKWSFSRRGSWGFRGCR